MSLLGETFNLVYVERDTLLSELPARTTHFFISK